MCVLILGEGQTSRCEKRERAEAGIVEQLHKNTLAAADVLGIKEVFFENFDLFHEIFLKKSINPKKYSENIPFGNF